MKSYRSTLLLYLPLTLAVFISGCGHKEGGDHHHDSEAAHDKNDGHGHGEESSVGATFKAGKGVILTAETRTNLNLQIFDMTERILPDVIPLTLQVFGEKHRPQLDSADHAGCDAHGSAFLPDAAAALIRPGQGVDVLLATNGPLHGVVLAAQKAPAIGESEVVIGISNAASVLKPGEFVPARILLPRAEPVTIVPESAVLQTSEGTFVYAVNGDAYFRTAVKTGARADGWVEIADGLYAGDQIVTQPVQTLYLIELRATKGGGHSH